MTKEFRRIQTDSGEIIIRTYEERDISAQVSYMCDSPQEFLEEIGFDTSKFPSRNEMIKKFRKRMIEQQASGLHGVIVAELDGRTIAVLFLDQAKQQDHLPRLHFHILEEQFRGKGLGGTILMVGLNVFYQIHKLNRFLIEPKANNERMNKLMRKLGFQYLKDDILEARPTTKEMKVSQYEIYIK